MPLGFGLAVTIGTLTAWTNRNYYFSINSNLLSTNHMQNEQTSFTI